jgi:hypothetical protein
VCTTRDGITSYENGLFSKVSCEGFAGGEVEDDMILYFNPNGTLGWCIWESETRRYAHNRSCSCIWEKSDVEDEKGFKLARKKP